MRKGDIVRTVMVVVALVLALTGEWPLLIFGTVCYQAGRVAALTLERRSQRHSQVLEGRG